MTNTPADDKNKFGLVRGEANFENNFFSWVTFHSLEEHVEEWDKIIPADHILRSTALLPIERSYPENLEFLYLIFYKKKTGQPQQAVAVAYFQLVNFTSNHYVSPFSTNALLKRIERMVIGKGFKILVCGNLFRIDFPGTYRNQEIISEDELIRLLHDFIQSLSPAPHAILLKDIPEDYMQPFLSLGYKAWKDDLTMKLELNPDWKSFEDYVMALRHKYAQRVRRARSKFKGISRKELSLEEMSCYAAEIRKLYNEVLVRQPIRMVIVNENYFLEMKKTYKEKFKVFGYFKDKTLIAFSSNILYNKVWELHYIGMQYSENEFFWLYFNIMFDAVADAIAEKKLEVEMGRTAREAKAVMGGQPVYFQNLYRLNGWLVQRIVNLLTKFFNRKVGKGWMKHHPFKANKNSE